MIPPKHRPIAAGLAAAVAITPLFTMGVMNGKTQGVKNEAETARQDRLEAVSKAYLSNNCYIVPAIIVGSEVPVQGRAQSVCISLKDESRLGFIEYQKGALTAIDAFSQKEVKAKISTLGVKK